MLSKSEALTLVQRHLGSTPRAAHSMFVAYLMGELARIFAADSELWQIVGLCHDLDFFVTVEDRSQHGILAARWLTGQLPEEALRAIAGHDHRTPIREDTPLADMLNLSDAVAVMDDALGREAFVGAATAAATNLALRSQLGDRGYLADILQQRIGQHGLSLERIIKIVGAGPAQ